MRGLMMSFLLWIHFCAKTSEKIKLLGEEKNLKTLKLSQKFVNYVFNDI